MKTVVVLVLCLGIGLSFFGCKPETPDLKDYIDGWECITTLKVYPSRSITIVEKRVKIISGSNNLLMVEIDRKPIFKENVEQINDLSNYRFLFIEINPSDTLINATHQGQSKLIREVIAMSPNFGANSLNPDEDIEIRKMNGSQWVIKSNLEDFTFEGEFSFSDSSKIIFNHKQMIKE